MSGAAKISLWNWVWSKRVCVWTPERARHRVQILFWTLDGFGFGFWVNLEP